MGQKHGDGWYAHAMLWDRVTSGGGLLGQELEVAGTGTEADALAEAHAMLDRYHRFAGLGTRVEIGIGFGESEIVDTEDAKSQPPAPKRTPRQFEVTDQAIADGQRLGLTGNIAAQLQQMCRRAARVTQPDPRFRHRFYEFALWIETDRLLGVAFIEPVHNSGHRRRRR